MNIFCTGVEDPEAQQLMEEISVAASPEEAARLGRAAQKSRPHLVRQDWETAKLFIMLAALKAKVQTPNLSSRSVRLLNSQHHPLL